MSVLMQFYTRHSNGAARPRQSPQSSPGCLDWMRTSLVREPNSHDCSWSKWPTHLPVLSHISTPLLQLLHRRIRLSFRSSHHWICFHQPFRSKYSNPHQTCSTDTKPSGYETDRLSQFCKGTFLASEEYGRNLFLEGQRGTDGKGSQFLILEMTRSIMRWHHALAYRFLRSIHSWRAPVDGWCKKQISRSLDNSAVHSAQAI